jgi:hypothetical protein
VSFSGAKCSPLEVIPPDCVQIAATPGFSAAKAGAAAAIANGTNKMAAKPNADLKGIVPSLCKVP